MAAEPTLAQRAFRAFDVDRARRAQRYPVLTGLLSALLAGLFAWQAAQTDWRAVPAAAARDRGWAVAWPPTDSSVWWRVLSCVFFHFGLAHLATNVATLLLFGAFLEVRHGWARMLAAVVTSGYAGALCFVAASTLQVWRRAGRALSFSAMTRAVLADAGAPAAVMCGFSSACYGLMGSYVTDFVLNPEAVAHKWVRLALTLLVASGVLIEPLVAGRGVALSAHAGGFAWGLAPALLYLPNHRFERWEWVIVTVAVVTGAYFVVAQPIVVSVALYGGVV